MEKRISVPEDMHECMPVEGFLLANQRASVTLGAFDILNKNQALSAMDWTITWYNEARMYCSAMRC